MGVYCYDREEVVKRMARRRKKSIKWTLETVTVEWKYIPATEAKNYDGSDAGSGNDPAQEVLQQTTWKLGGSPRFSNWW
jgi:hypothetical protein